MNQNDPPTEHILACLSSSPSNAKIVRTAATMAKAFGGTFTALYVRTPDSDQMGKEDCRRLQQHIRMAEQAGADISTIYGDDIPQQIAEFARISGITKIVLGRSSVHRRHFWSGPSLTEKLTMTAPNLDIYIIPDASAENGYGSGRKLFIRPFLPSVRDLLVTAGILSCITLIGFLFLQLDFARYNIITFYMLGVLFTALCTSGYTCGVLGSIASVALYNFFLTEPRLTFHAYDPGYQVTFALMLTSAIITCTLTTRLKDHAKMSAQAAFRTKILFDTNQLLQRAKSEEEILSQTASQLMKLLNRSLIVYPEQNGDLGLEQVFWVDGKTVQNIFSAPEERDAANWTFANKKRSGAGTDSYPDAKGLYLALRTGGGVFGVVGIDLSEKPLDAFENSVLLSILGEGALAIENRRNALEKEQAALQARNEELRANLLRTISHDLRTPLTSILGYLQLVEEDSLTPEQRREYLAVIRSRAATLQTLITSFYDLSRIEGGQWQLEREPVDLARELADQLAAAYEQLEQAGLQVSVKIADGLPPVWGDRNGVVRVLSNLLTNAYRHGTGTLEARLYREGDHVVSAFSNDAPGMTDEDVERVFERFYTVDRMRTGQNTGLGMAIVKALAERMGGQVSARLEDGRFTAQVSWKAAG